MKRSSLATLSAALLIAVGLSLPTRAADDNAPAPATTPAPTPAPAPAPDTAPASAPATAAAPRALELPQRDPREPARLPVSWELNFKHGPLERIIVNVDGKDQPFWYMRYTVTNMSGRDVLFTPNFQIVAETGAVIDAYKAAPDGVFDKIKKLHGNPLLLSSITIDGKILQGDDNAKDAVAIFPALDPEARNFRVFVLGLSGETSEVTNPVTHQPVLLQKTLELDYNIPGQAIAIDPQPKLTGQTWVMK